MQSAALGGNGVHSCLGFFVFFVGGGGLSIGMCDNLRGRMTTLFVLETA